MDKLPVTELSAEEGGHAGGHEEGEEDWDKPSGTNFPAPLPHWSTYQPVETPTPRICREIPFGIHSN